MRVSNPTSSKLNGEASPIPGTVIFDGVEAQKGYALNKMCYSFNRAENRAAFARDEDGYCRAYGITPAQREAIRRRDVLALVHLGRGLPVAKLNPYLRAFL